MVTAAKAGGRALSPPEFAAAMAALAPLPRPPRLAVAVSGGPDSVALCLLADAWARGRGGTVHALTVDHGLRPSSGAEAAQVGCWFDRRSIPHAVLPWHGAKPARGVQEAARDVRYRLLTDWCREAGIAALLLGHHEGDQAETFLFRLARGSGTAGLAAMAPVAERGGVRLLRPLLGFPKARLEATLRAIGQGWVRDPSNADRGFARTRARRRVAELAAAGLAPADLARAAARSARARAGAEALAEALLAETAEFEDGGFCRLSVPALTDAEHEVARLVLARVLAAVGGRPRAPRRDALDRALQAIIEARVLQPKRQTVHQPVRQPGCLSLHHCLLLPARAGELWIVRENRNLETLPLALGQHRLWDGRFEVRLEAGPAHGASVAALGEAGWRAVRADARAAPPARVRQTLPALWRDGELLAVPALGLGARKVRFSARFRVPGDPLQLYRPGSSLSYESSPGLACPRGTAPAAAAANRAGNS